jgi:hypothetical protein
MATGRQTNARTLNSAHTGPFNPIMLFICLLSSLYDPLSSFFIHYVPYKVQHNKKVSKIYVYGLVWPYVIYSFFNPFKPNLT